MTLNKTKEELIQLCDEMIPGIVSYHASQISLQTKELTYDYKDKTPSDEDIKFVLVFTLDDMKALCSTLKEKFTSESKIE
ncbi:hypothetical protein [Parageobacillus galactosidasius]|uniref:Uncharacterized protein n=1 Tax=Parageobacillus galactosidasius TaxID=883812 RepID=A0A226QQV6_9BACL|nr:hypothetical protein [Parageobacillus galactosidasius]OXB94873.1 hypothetical protein B9L23_08400 [Parageobacillus galactosidasius]